MEKITYKGKEYNVFPINLKDIFSDNCSLETLVAEDELWDAMENDFDIGVSEAINLDERIFCYLPNGYLDDKTTYEEIISIIKRDYC